MQKTTNIIIGIVWAVIMLILGMYLGFLACLSVLKGQRVESSTPVIKTSYSLSVKPYSDTWTGVTEDFDIQPAGGYKLVQNTRSLR